MSMASNRHFNRRLRPLRVPERRPWLIVLGCSASVLMHGLLFLPLMYGGQAVHPVRMPASEGASSSSHEQSDSEHMQLVFVNDANGINLSAEGPQLPESTHLPVLQPISAPQTLPVFVKVDPQNPAESPVEAAGDQVGHALLFGRYMGQISARIQRAWVRPRTLLTKEEFQCRVQILQDKSGSVQEITLQECDGDLRWQTSLVQAIQAASPLPAPPDPDVFSNIVSLELDSDTYHAGSTEDGYELVRR